MAIYPLSSSNPVNVNEQPINGLRMTGLILLHMLVAQLTRWFPLVGYLHFSVILLMILEALFSKNLQKSARLFAYISSAEVLWRMNHVTMLGYFEGISIYAAPFFLIGFLMLRGIKRPALPLLYILCILPATILVISKIQGDSLFAPARWRVVDGTLAQILMAVAVLFFSRIKFVTRRQLSDIFLAFIYPVAGIAQICLYSIWTAEKISFANESNVTITGGLNPIEVSTALGAGLFFICFHLLSNRTKGLARNALMVLAIVFTALMALTFARTGIYTAAVAIFTASFYLIQTRKARRNFLVFAGLIGLVFYFAIWPFLVNFTNGAIVERLQAKSVTGRDEIMKDDIRIWRENFWLGVGPGEVVKYRKVFTRGMPFGSHSEYSRFLAEHGVLGLFAILLLFMIAAAHFRRARTNLDKALILGCSAWVFLFMLVAPVRLLLPSLMFGLTAVVPLKDIFRPKPPVKEISHPVS